MSLLFTGALFVAAESFGAQPAREVSLSVDAKTSRDRGRSQQVEERVNGSVTTTVDTETEGCVLDVRVGSAAEQGDACQLEWFFISERTAGKGNKELVIFDSGKEEMTLQKGEDRKKTIASKPFIFSIRTSDRLRNDAPNNMGNSERVQQGDTYAGYIVLVKAGGEILRKRSSDDRFLKDEWIARCEAAAKTPAAPAEKKKKKN